MLPCVELVLFEEMGTSCAGTICLPVQPFTLHGPGLPHRQRAPRNVSWDSMPLVFLPERSTQERFLWVWVKDPAFFDPRKGGQTMLLQALRQDMKNLDTP